MPPSTTRNEGDRGDPAPAGVLVVDKDRGPTSHDVVARLRRLLRTREIGHAGTLDPMASGVLVVAVGEATKLVPYLTAADKSYVATIALGVATDSLDADGAVVRTEAIPAALAEALAAVAEGRAAPLVDAAIDAERRRTAQVPPAFSAIHHEGTRAHVLARRGEAPVLAPRDVVVHALRVTAATVAPAASLSVSVDVGKGYYVRSLAHDLAAALGTVGHLTALRRTRSAPFDLAEAISLDAAALRERIVPLPRAAARVLPSITLGAIAVRDARAGRAVAAADLGACGEGAPTAWFDDGGALVAIGRADADGVGRVLRGFRE